MVFRMIQTKIHHSKLERLSEIRAQVSELYKEKSRLENEVIDELLSGEEKNREVALNDNDKMILVYTVEKKIDYERLRALYPKVYEMGLQTTFSMSKALMAVDNTFLRDIIKDCTIEDKGYVAKYEKTKVKRGKKKYE